MNPMRIAINFRRILFVTSLMLLAIGATSQLGHCQAAYLVSRDTGVIKTSGGTWTHNNSIGELSLNFELVINGSPTSSTITIQGCGRGNVATYGSTLGLNGQPTAVPTCVTLDTYTANANAVRYINAFYDSYVVTFTFSGGTNPTLQINETGSSASSGGNNTGLASASGAPPNGLLGVSGSFVSYSPTQLGMNALAYGSNATTANTNIIDTRGVKAWTLLFNCTSLGTLQLNDYLEDGLTSFLNTSVVTTTVAAATSVTLSAGGTSYASQGSPGVTTPNLPQRAISFAFLNTNATAGTCTGRLFLAY